MRIGELDFFDVKVENRDFQGKKFGPNYRTFAVEIVDEELKQRLQSWGMNLWHTQPRNDDPPRCKMNIRVDNKFGNVNIILVDTDDTAIKLDPNNQMDMKLMDEAWINGANMHVTVSKFTDPRGIERVTAYLEELVAMKLPQAEVDRIRQENINRSNPVRERFAKYFG